MQFTVSAAKLQRPIARTNPSRDEDCTISVTQSLYHRNHRAAAARKPAPAADFQASDHAADEGNWQNYQSLCPWDIYPHGPTDEKVV
jgi:hypothetical protein